jgi:Ca2+-binding RTX toxin-like protein
VEAVNLAGGAAAQTFDISAWNSGGSLNGAGGNDTLVVSKDTDMTLTNGGLTYGTSSTKFWTLASIEIAELTGGAAANYLKANTFSGAVTMTGLGGNDVLLGGNGKDTLIGGDGNDWLGGGAGNDRLEGGNHADILVGGLGVDIIGTSGTDSGDDIVIGGRTNYDSNKTAIDALITAWATKASFTAGVSSIGTGFTSGGVTYKLNTTTVFDDDVTDTFFGGAGLDWFFADVKPTTTIGLENPDDTGAETSALVDI